MRDVKLIPKQYRLKNKYAFNATYRVCNSYHKGGVTLYVGKLKNIDCPTKVGFIVSKKTHKRAVRRNRLKRLMRESYRLLLKENNLGESQNYQSLIFIGTTHALDKNLKFIKKNIETLLKGIKNV